MPISFSKYDLPIIQYFPLIKNTLRDNNRLIITASPGAGKSTLLPLFLEEENINNGKKIIVLEPRRLAARSIAARMSEIKGDELGKSIGYKIRFENKTSNETKIEVVTEGILTRLLQSDNALEEASIIVFDEFHERSIHADLALALCLETQQVLRPDLKIIIMSATINADEISKKINAEVISCEGKQYPVKINYGNGRDLKVISELCAEQILRASKENEGDILAFLPGEAEIKKTEELIKYKLDNTKVHPLYSALPYSLQKSAILPNTNGKRKVVLATTIAETSLTIEGIKIVIDTGLTRVSKYNPKTGLSRLETVAISKDAADQRAGRAGRLSPGICYRLWSRADHDKLAEHRVPEILESDLCPLMLELFQWGIQKPEDLFWLDFPPKIQIYKAIETLEQLNAIESNKITKHGNRMAQLPCHPRLAHMLILAEEMGKLALACDIAALLEEKDPLGRESGIDFNLRIEALRRYRQQAAKGGKWERIEKIAASYRKMFKVDIDNSAFDYYDTGYLIASVYPEKIASSRPGNNSQFLMANGKIAQAGPKDDLGFEPWLAVAAADEGDRIGRIFLAAPLNPTDLKSLIREKQIIDWDFKSGSLVCSTDLRIGNIVLKSSPLKNPNPELVLNAVKKSLINNPERLIKIDEKTEQLINRISCLKIWTNEKIEDLSIIESVEKGLFDDDLKRVKNLNDLEKIDWFSTLYYSLNPEIQKKLNELIPEKIEVPSGSELKIKYKKNGENPILSVRLQELFGLAESPQINNGKNKLIIELLSPGFKPVQLTSDLKSFWNSTYFEVKKEMKRQYPKHYWPDDPWNAEAIKGSKKAKK